MCPKQPADQLVCPSQDATPVCTPSLLERRKSIVVGDDDADDEITIKMPTVDKEEEDEEGDEEEAGDGEEQDESESEEPSEEEAE